MPEHTPPWPKQGPASYFPSIERKYGRSIAEQQVIAACGLDKHMAIVNYLKSEHDMGHGHANALVGWTLAGYTAADPEGGPRPPMRLSEWSCQLRAGASRSHSSVARG